MTEVTMIVQFVDVSIMYIEDMFSYMNTVLFQVQWSYWKKWFDN